MFVKAYNKWYCVCEKMFTYSEHTVINGLSVHLRSIIFAEHIREYYYYRELLCSHIHGI